MEEPKAVLEISGADPAASISPALEKLGEGESLELQIADGAAPAAVMAELVARHGNSFDWWMLDATRALVVKREGAPRTISAFLGADHHRLTRYWEDFIATVETCEMSYETLFRTEPGNRHAIVDRLRHFIFGLRRHIRMEEECLFPRLEERGRLPAGAGPTAVMRTEHRAIEQILTSLENDLASGNCATLIQTIENQPIHPSDLFRSHDMKEESVLYPLADRLFDQDEREELRRLMQAV